MSRPTDTGRTFAELACHLLQSGVAGSPSQAAVMACDLVPISRKLHKLAEDRCNGEVPNYARKSADLLMSANLGSDDGHGTITLIARGVWKTDPRAGFGLLLVFPDGRTNDFGQEGIIVPCKVTD